MTVRFLNKSDMKKCASVNSLKRHFGDSGEKIAQRLNELRAADTLADISCFPPARCHELTGDRKGVFSVDLKHPFRLLFRPDGEPPLSDDGGIDRRRVRAIVVVKLHEDTH